MLLIVALCVLAGVASRRWPVLLPAIAAIAVGLYVLAVGPFLVWAARCGGCGSSMSYDTARSYEAMVINVWWGSILATVIAATWIGSWAQRRWL